MMRGTVKAIAKDRPIPIHQQLEEMLLEEIASGRLKPGDQVFSEHHVAKRYEVSRTTVRSVYDRLVTRGVLTRSAGKGTFVALPAMTENISLLVGFSQKMNAAGVSPTTRILAVNVTQPSAEAATALQIDSTAKIVEVERLRLLRDVPFVIHTAVLPYPRFESVLDYDLERGRMTEYLQTATGFNLDRAEETILACPAGVQETRLLQIPENYPVLIVRGTTYTTDGLPVRYSIARYHAGIVRLRTTQERGRDRP